MKKLSCQVNVAQMMKEPSHQAEVHTQLYFRDCAFVAEEPVGSWVKIVTINHQTTGWVLKSQFTELDIQHEVTFPYIVFGHHTSMINEHHTLPLLNGTYLRESDITSLNQTNQLIAIDAVPAEHRARTHRAERGDQFLVMAEHRRDQLVGVWAGLGPTTSSAINRSLRTSRRAPWRSRRNTPYPVE